MIQNVSAFHIMAKPNGPLCNLDCSYCFYLEKKKLYPDNKNWVMSNTVLETFIKQYITAQDVNEVFFTWQGGEPTLLGIDFFKKVIQLQNKYACGKTINNSFQTNGILINNEWCSFLKQNNFLVGISIDGPADLHNKYRFFKGGQPSFDKVYNSIKLFKKYDIAFNTLTCVQKDNSYKPLDVYNFLKEIDSRFIQFIPVVERITDVTSDQILVLPEYNQKADVSPWSVEPLQYGKFLSAVFDEWVQKDVGKYYVQIFDVALENWYGVFPNLCVFNETCGTAMALEHNGDLYSCDHYVFPEYKLGNILESSMSSLVNSGRQIKFGIDKKMKLPMYCLKCDYKFACNGECPKHRFCNTPDGEFGLNYLCEGYKYFFAHIDPFMKFMVNELLNNRPPANVMKWKN